jgi:predicted polyphosphate/ATP-dependent NAD kinase
LERRQLGLIVNPIAGLGGRVGLKGSDGLEVQQRARQLGAEPLAQERTAEALEVLRSLSIELLTPPGEMGEAVARRCGFSPHLLPLFPSGDSAQGERGETTADDTRRAAQAMRAAEVDLILYAGGDGTARDIYEAIGNDFPVLGIPAGVKIHSAVFGLTPRRTGELAREFLEGKRTRLREAEVLDLDEAAYREDRIVTRLYGYLKIPYRREYVQNQKVPTPAGESVQAQAIAAEVIERMAPGQAYLLGPGTTTRAVAERLGLPKTLVGVDIITRNEVLSMDVGERQILEMLEKRPLGMIVTPTGGQGFLFGRGNQQLSPEVIRKVGRDHILVVSLRSKIAALRGEPLLVDSGDLRVDNLLAGYVEVVTGYHEKIIYRVST